MALPFIEICRVKIKFSSKPTYVLELKNRDFRQVNEVIKKAYHEAILSYVFYLTFGDQLFFVKALSF